MNERILTGWEPRHAASWGQEPVCIGHGLHRHPLFAMAALAELIERYPTEHYALVYMGAQGDKRFWREGTTGGLSGREVIDWIAAGRMWLNLRRVNSVDSRYGELLDRIFGEIGEHVPGDTPRERHCGILISSPNAQVYYHADMPGQSLWQIHGRKRVYLYPTGAPFLSDEQLEHIALREVEVDVAYDPDYDKHAKVFELEGGQMLHWPLNAPHRVENHGVLNVSMTVEYWTEAVRRNYMVALANGILRQKLGVRPRSRTTTGAGFLAKAVLQSGARRLGLLRKVRQSQRPLTFELDPRQPGQVRDLAPAPTA